MNLVSCGKLRTLDLDIENRPLTYLGRDYTTAEVTAIACGWADGEKVWCWLLGPHTQVEMLTGFRDMYDRADIVTGHYLRKHDLPMINGALLEERMTPLAAKMTSDTYHDLVKRRGVSASQESLADMLDLVSPKVGMPQGKWREANRLTAKGIPLARQRVVGDVRQHRELRARLIELGMLGPPKMWRPKG